jgi:hypothetical protein
VTASLVKVSPEHPLHLHRCSSEAVESPERDAEGISAHAVSVDGHTAATASSTPVLDIHERHGVFSDFGSLDRCN